LASGSTCATGRIQRGSFQRSPNRTRRIEVMPNNDVPGKCRTNATMARCIPRSMLGASRRHKYSAQTPEIDRTERGMTTPALHAQHRNDASDCTKLAPIGHAPPTTAKKMGSLEGYLDSRDVDRVLSHGFLLAVKNVRKGPARNNKHPMGRALRGNRLPNPMSSFHQRLH